MSRPRRHRPLNEGRGVTSCSSAQRRPGREPRRHFRVDARGGSQACAQRRPGREPRRHSNTGAGSATGGAALSEGRGVNPGDTCRTTRFRSSWSSLNEGRGVNPGDTSVLKIDGVTLQPAQRRPGREPRRHCCCHVCSLCWSAQRRPGREPRRHLSTHCTPQTFTSSAQRRPGRGPRRHRPSGCRRCRPRSLNEGRGVNPGDTACVVRTVRAPDTAQRRPGREPRRHAGERQGAGAEGPRSTKAGA